MLGLDSILIFFLIQRVNMNNCSQLLHVIAGFFFPPVLFHLQSSPVSTLYFFPLGGAFLSLWLYAALGMKLYSYQETNRWYQRAHVSDAGIS